MSWLKSANVTLRPNGTDSRAIDDQKSDRRRVSLEKTTRRLLLTTGLCLTPVLAFPPLATATAGFSSNALQCALIFEQSPPAVLLTLENPIQTINSRLRVFFWNKLTALNAHSIAATKRIAPPSDLVLHQTVNEMVSVFWLQEARLRDESIYWSESLVHDFQYWTLDEQIALADAAVELKAPANLQPDAVGSDPSRRSRPWDVVATPKAFFMGQVGFLWVKYRSANGLKPLQRLNDKP